MTTSTEETDSNLEWESIARPKYLFWGAIAPTFIGLMLYGCLYSMFVKNDYSIEIFVGLAIVIIGAAIFYNDTLPAVISCVTRKPYIGFYANRIVYGRQAIPWETVDTINSLNDQGDFGITVRLKGQETAVKINLLRGSKDPLEGMDAVKRIAMVVSLDRLASMSKDELELLKQAKRSAT